MSGSPSPEKSQEAALKALERRADAIVKARSAYKEMVDFYLTVFRRQIEWRDRLAARPAPVDREQVRTCLSAGEPLIERYDPGLESDSLLALWAEMKEVFRRGNAVLCKAVEKIEEVERSGDFSPASWLMEQRPERGCLVREVAERIGVEEPMLASLARAVTFPHWRLVAASWLPSSGRLHEWKRFCCPTCGDTPALVELCTAPGEDGNISPAPQRFMHCAFCGSRWKVEDMKCPACASTKSGDAKYYFTSEEPELRIDFCKSCNHYVKVIDSGKISGEVHVGLELLTTAHLDAIAQEKNLTPLETCA
ncbi:MAG: formate dehydrogenase accessory protein FdhE [Phycisphaerae bacterium]|nr:formate dehydrogenase accessory protein FdhE [Phycisphaerae bacterium]